MFTSLSRGNLLIIDFTVVIMINVDFSVRLMRAVGGEGLAGRQKITLQCVTAEERINVKKNKTLYCKSLLPLMK